MRGEIKARVSVGSLQVLAPSRTTLLQRGHGVLEPVVDHDVRELLPRRELLAGGREPPLDVLGVIGAAPDQPRRAAPPPRAGR